MRLLSREGLKGSVIESHPYGASLGSRYTRQGERQQIILAGLAQRDVFGLISICTLSKGKERGEL